MHEAASMQSGPSVFLRRIRWWVVGILAAAFLLLAAWGGLALHGLFTPVALPHPEIIRVQKAASFKFVAESLHRRGLIPNAFAFRLYARVKGFAGKLKVGDYEVRGGMAPVQMLDLMVSGRGRLFEVTIPEGKWASEIAQTIARQWPKAGAEFLPLVRRPEHWQQQMPFLKGAATLEGFLFPDTYYFPTDAQAELMITRMLERFRATCAEAYQATPPADGRTLYQVLTLASLVEGEARRDAERPVIAGVYMNRLRTPGWTLDCDATLIYARQQRVSRLLNSDKLLESPYNSYRRRGLPPGPINNPGIKSFQAALHPETVPFFFYVARGDGSHVFARTLAEQSANIARFREN